VGEPPSRQRAILIGFKGGTNSIVGDDLVFRGDTELLDNIVVHDAIGTATNAPSVAPGPPGPTRICLPPAEPMPPLPPLIVPYCSAS
jgi:hypothetical protein